MKQQERYRSSQADYLDSHLAQHSFVFPRWPVGRA